MSDPDLILPHIKSLGFEARLTGDGEHAVFAARDPKTGETYMTKGSIGRQYETVCELEGIAAVSMQPNVGLPLAPEVLTSEHGISGRTYSRRNITKRAGVYCGKTGMRDARKTLKHGGSR